MRTRINLGYSMVALAAVITMTGCAAKTETPAASKSTSTADRAGQCPSSNQWPPSPTAEQLSALLKKGLDPNVPAADKVELVQGVAGDPDLFNRVGVALRANKFSAKINGVTDYCNGTANADATLTISGQTNDSQVPLVAESDIWKLDKDWACGLAKSLQQSSPICP